MSQGCVASKDGTAIAYEHAGRGPAVVLVGGGLTDRAENVPLFEELARDFSVYNYDRRGRGRSGDTLPYALAREVEDIAALVAKAGGHAHVYGVSSGGALALEAAAAGLAIDGVALYEVPYDDAPEVPEQMGAYVQELEMLLARGRRGDALALFMRVAGSSEEDIAGAKESPMWPGLLELAHTLAYDAACLGDRTPPATRLARIQQPVLVATGGSVESFERGADALAAHLPRAERRVVEGQGHVVDATVLAPWLVRFFSASSG